jgi:GNAT superfamily N-acetyltransferase
MGQAMTGCTMDFTEMTSFLETDLLRYLTAPGRMRFYGHFDDEKLDGQLIEEIRAEVPKKVDIRWIMAKNKGTGIGNELLADCIQRAKDERTTVLTTTLSRLNKPAFNLYEKFGFHEYKRYEGVDKSISLRRLFL